MQQCIELTVTNSPFGLTVKFTLHNKSDRIRLVSQFCSAVARQYSSLSHEFVSRLHRRLQRVWVTIARGSHPFPSRTRQLSPSAPMVLHWRQCGRVGRRPINLQKGPAKRSGLFVLSQGQVHGDDGALSHFTADLDFAAMLPDNLPGSKQVPVACGHPLPFHPEAGFHCRYQLPL